MSQAVVRFGEEARRPTAAGVDVLADLVACTIGPSGRAVLVGRNHAAPKLLRNGYAIAAELELGNHAEQTGVRMLRELAWRTSDATGDGTSTAILIARALLRAGQQAPLVGIPQAELVERVEAHGAAVAAVLETMAEPMANDDGVAAFATQAAGGDAALGELLAEAHTLAGADGLVLVEEGQGSQDALRFDAGLHFPEGWLSHHLVDDEQHQSIELDDPLVLLHAGPIAALDPMVRVLEMIAEAGRSLLVVAEEVEERALATLVLNKRRAGLKVAAVKAPGAGPWRRLMLEDIAVATGATVIAADRGETLEGLRPQVMGRAEKARIGRKDTTIIGGRGEEAAIAARRADIRRTIEREKHLSFDREQHSKRLARFATGVATLHVGGITATQLKQRVEVARAASSAIGAARRGGLVAGGAAALVHAAGDVRTTLSHGLSDRLLARTLKAATEAPLRAIVRNAGGDADLVIPRVAEDRARTYDAISREMVPVRALRDPLPVVLTAFRNALSTASRLLTVEAALGAPRRRLTKE